MGFGPNNRPSRVWWGEPLVPSRCSGGGLGGPWPHKPRGHGYLSPGVGKQTAQHVPRDSRHPGSPGPQPHVCTMETTGRGSSECTRGPHPAQVQPPPKQRLQQKAQAWKTPREKQSKTNQNKAREKLPDLGPGSDFIDRTLMTQATKTLL